MDYLVLMDSNAIIGNQYKASTDKLKEFFINNKLVIAEPTIKEVINKFNENQIVKEEKLNKAINDAKKFGIDTKVISNKRNDFENSLNEELKELNVEILSSEEADINFIFNKSMLRKKPFSINGKGRETGGFRDVLIWNIWLNYLEKYHKQYRKILIVNADSDFIEETNLHNDLIEDLKLKDVSIEKIKVIKSIKSLTEEVLTYLNDNNFHKVLSDLELNEIQSQIIDEAISTEKISEAIYTSLENHYPIEYEPRIDWLERNNKPQTLSVLGDKDGIYLYFLEDFIFNVEYYIPKYEYYIEDSHRIAIVDSNWNKWVMLVSEEFTVQIGFECSLDRETKAVLNMSYYVGDELELIPFHSTEEEFNET